MKVLSRKQIFAQYKSYDLDHGLTIDELLCMLDYPEQVYPYVEVRINGYKIDQKIWSKTRPNENTVTSVSIVPAGGDNAGLATLATIGLVFAAGPLAGALGATGFGAGVLAAGITLAGSLLINSMFPPPKPEISSEKISRFPTITGQSNRIDLYGPVIRNYGYNRIFPRLITEPNIYYVGNDQYLQAIYDFGIGENEIQESTIRIGDTPINQYNDLDINIASNPDELEIFTQTIVNEDFVVPFANPNDSAIRTSANLSESIELTFQYPGGLVAYVGRKYRRRKVSQTLDIRIRETGTTTWRKFTEFSNEISSFASLQNKTNFPILVKPAVLQTIDTKTTYYNSVGLNVSVTYTYQITFNSNILDYKVIGPADFSGGISQPLQLNDTVRIGASTYRVVEILTNPLGGDYRKVRVDRTINYSTQVTEGGFIYTGEQVKRNEPNGYGFRADASSQEQNLVITRETPSTFNYSVKINPREGRKQWDVWVKLFDEDLPYGSLKVLKKEFNWTGIRSYSSQSPIASTKTHTYLEVKIKATDQLNGTLDNLSGEVFSILEYYDDINGTWKKKATNNPAWVLVDLLTGSVNQRAISKDKLDIDSIVAWAKYCEENTITWEGLERGFECNFVLDFESTVRELASQVCSVGRATLNVANGIYGVIIDEYRTTPTQIFNQRNIKSFSSERAYAKIPDAIKCIYTDPVSNWQKNEVTAYNDGYDSSTAQTVEEIEIFGATNPAQAWRQGRYFLASQILRQDTVIIGVDFENLVCSRGDLVYFSHDVMKNGGEPGRVVAINGNEVTLDISVGDLGGNEVLRIRKRINDTIQDSNVLSFTGTNTIELDDVSNIQIDDLCVFGQVNAVTEPYIVKSINFENEFNASLTLIEYDEDIYQADTGTIPIYTAFSANSPLAGGSYPGPVQNLSYTYTVDCHDSEKRYIYITELTWDTPINGIVDVYEVYVNIDGQQQLAGFSRTGFFRYEVEGLQIGVEHVFKVIGVDSFGRKSPLGEATALAFTPEDDSTIPEDVQNFNSNLLTETIALNWDLVSDCDIDRYYIRFSPKTTGALWEQSTLVTSTGPTQNTVQVPIRTGTYFIKARDWSGNNSATANRVVTQIPEILNIDFISEIDAPVWEGTAINTAPYGDTLTLRSNDGFETFVEEEGDFVFRQVFDLGDIYTARFTSEILASGFTKSSLMINWVTLASVDPIGGNFTDDDWDVSTLVRARTSADYMVDWSTLTEVDYLSFGSEANVAPWQRFTNADFTGRIFQIKTQLSTADQTVSPIVDSVRVIANWTDRIEQDRDVFSGPVEFTNAFINLPALQITAQENIQPGDYYIITNKTVSGFTLQFYDAGNNPVNDRKYDWIAKGFGKNYTEEELNF